MVDRYRPVADCVVATVTAYNAAHPDGEFVKWADYDALSARVAELREYAWHKPECEFLKDTLPCTCGLEACLSDADGGKHG